MAPACIISEIKRGPPRIVIPFGGKKTGMVWLPDGEKSVMTGLAVSIEYRRVTDRQTDRHLATASALYIASRCKKLFDMQYTSVGAVTARIIKRLTLL